MTVYSHSKISTFEQCPLKYKFRYIDKIIPEIKETIECFLGKKVHETLEWVYKIAWERDLEIDDLVEHFAINWKKDLSDDIAIVKEEFNSEYYFNKGIRFLVDYFLKHQPFRDNTIETEKRIFVNLDSLGNYKVVGFIDRLVHHKDSNIFEIHDYKTTSSLKTQEELDNDRQLALYSIGIRNSFDKVDDVHLVWHFLDFNQQKISKRTHEQLEILKKQIIELIDKIENTKEFLANPGCLCNWCEFKNQCSSSKEAVCEPGHNHYNDQEKEIQTGLG
jgi:putative RecB family exonuclease